MKTHEWNGMTSEIHPAEDFMDDGTPSCVECRFITGPCCPGLDRDATYPCTRDRIIFKALEVTR